MTQLTLDVPTTPPAPTTAERWEAWADTHPEFVALCLDLARHRAAEGARISAKGLVESLRHTVAGGVNNSYTPHLARRLLDLDPTLAPFLRFRSQRHD